VFYLGLSLALGACSGGYPLPPTRCDEWCDATKGGNCVEYYNPAGCVSSCETAGMSQPACATQLDAMIACYRKNPGAAQQLCDYGINGLPCQNEISELGVCASSSMGRTIVD
jgi:hypothetical protein